MHASEVFIHYFTSPPAPGARHGVDAGGACGWRQPTGGRAAAAAAEAEAEAEEEAEAEAEAAAEEEELLLGCI